MDFYSIAQFPSFDFLNVSLIISSYFRVPSKEITWSKLELIHRNILIVDMIYADLHKIFREDKIFNLPFNRYQRFHEFYDKN